MTTRNDPERVRTDPRISRRRQAVRRTRRKRILGAIAGVAFVAVSTWAAFFSPLLSVREVRVVGGQHTSSDQIAAIAGLDESDNLLLLSTSSVEDDVAELPWVAEATVDRRLPHTVQVKVSERKPALYVELPAGRWSIDADGRVLGHGRAEKNLPLLGGVVMGALSPGTKVDHSGVIAGLRVWRSLPDRLTEDIVALFAPTPERISFSFADRTLVRYGAARQRVAKRRVLLALLQRMRHRRIRAAYIDIRVPTNPAIAPRATPSPLTTPLG